MSEFWTRKIRTYFRVWDLNKDGVVTKEDMDLLGARFGADVDEVRRVVQSFSLSQLYNIYEKMAGSDGHISEQGLIEALEKLRPDPGFAGLVRMVAALLFYYLDVDGDKDISGAEFVRYFKCLGFPDSERLAKEALEDVDTDHDGKVSLTEIGDALINYLVSDDETVPGSKLFGDLVD